METPSRGFCGGGRWYIGCGAYQAGRKKAAGREQGVIKTSEGAAGRVGDWVDRWRQGSSEKVKAMVTSSGGNKAVLSQRRHTEIHKCTKGESECGFALSTWSLELPSCNLFFFARWAAGSLGSQGRSFKKVDGKVDNEVNDMVERKERRPTTRNNFFQKTREIYGQCLCMTETAFHFYLFMKSKLSQWS